MWFLGQVPERSMPPGVEHSVVVGRRNVAQFDGVGELILGRAVRIEASRGFSLRIR
jgi:hypothetical protein